MANATVDEEKVDGLDGLEPEPAKPSFFNRNWPLPTFVLGAMLMLLALWYWKVPMTDRRRDQFLEDLAKARELSTEKPYAAKQLLGSLLSRLWRVPEARGEIYYLLGHANEELAKAAVNDAFTRNEYRRIALEAFTNADQVGVPPWAKLPLHEELGETLILVGDNAKLNLAITSLNDALQRRDTIAWIIDRRELQALLDQDEPNAKTIDDVVRRWNAIDDVPESLKDLSLKASELVQAGRTDDLKEFIAAVDLSAITDEHHQAGEIDHELRTLIELGVSDEAIPLAMKEHRENDRRRSSILKHLAQGSMRLTPAADADANRLAHRRLALTYLDDDDRAEARLALSEIQIATGHPELARAELKGVTGSAEQNRRAALLLGKSLLDEADQLRRMPLEEFVKSRPSLRAISQWVQQNSSTLGDHDAGVVSSVERSILTLADPARLKDVLMRSQYQRSIETFRKAFDDPELPDETKGEIRLWIGVALSALGRHQESQATFREVIHDIGTGPIEQAAQFYLADALSRAGRPAESLAALKESLATVKRPEQFKNPFLRQTTLRDMFIEEWDRYHQKTNDYASAVALAELYRSFKMPVVEPGEPQDLVARSSAALAEQLKTQAEQAEEDSARIPLAADSRSRFRDAGRAYVEVSRIREGSDDYPALLWEAATHLFEGHAFREAAPVFEKFIVAHVGGPRDFLARIYLARCHMAMEDNTAAREVLEQSLRDSPTAVDRFRGRILLAECYREVARRLPQEEGSASQRSALVKLAEDLLITNLSGQNQELEPSAAEWRDSLFQLGKILLETERYDEAIERFQEYGRRYPTGPDALETEYGIGEAYLTSASLLDAKLEDPDLPEREKSRIRDDRSRRYEQALAQFHRLSANLTAISEKRPLTDREDLLLGTALFRIGRIHVLLAQWPSALEAYENVAYRYLDQPECLAGYVEMATVYQRLGREADAKSTLRQALWVLERIDEEAFVRSDRQRDEIRRQIQDLLGSP